MEARETWGRAEEEGVWRMTEEVEEKIVRVGKMEEGEEEKGEEEEEEDSAPSTSQGCDFFPLSSSLHFFKFIEHCLDVRMFVQ